jgi:hypothetical protein
LGPSYTFFVTLDEHALKPSDTAPSFTSLLHPHSSAAPRTKAAIRARVMAGPPSAPHNKQAVCRFEVGGFRGSFGGKREVTTPIV